MSNLNQSCTSGSPNRLWASILISGVCLGLGWILPPGIQAIILGIVAAFAFTILIYQSQNLSWPKAFLSSYCVGLLSQALAFWWMIETVEKYGGVSRIYALFVFTLFLITASVQFGLIPILYRLAPLWARSSVLLVPAIVVSLEFIFPRIYPWQFGHLMLGASVLTQSAEIFGALSVSALLFLFCSAAYLMVLGINRKTAAASLLIVLVAIGFGDGRVKKLSTKEYPKVRVGLVQANIPIKNKHNQALKEQNAAAHLIASRKLLEEKDPPDIIIWPESALNEWFDAMLKKRAQDPRLPYSDQASIIFGALSFLDPKDKTKELEKFNSVFAVTTQGNVLLPYHKQVLMPFGEYVPFAKTFPWLREAATGIADFTAGKDLTLFPLSTRDGKGVVASPLICYEDMLPQLSRASVLNGAQLIINLTNDGWFGQSAAVWQHYRIAAFRAIENNRYLLRSTNTGVSAVVSPTGTPLLLLKPFSSQHASVDVPLPSRKTLYTTVFGDTIWWITSGLLLLLIVIGLRTKK